MRHLISDFNSMKAIPNLIPKNAIPTPIQMMAIPIQFQFRLDWVKPIPELDFELARKSNSGAELTPTLLCGAAFKALPHVTMDFNIAKIGSARASSTISSTLSLRVAGPSIGSAMSTDASTYLLGGATVSFYTLYSLSGAAFDRECA